MSGYCIINDLKNDFSEQMLCHNCDYDINAYTVIVHPC